MQEVTVDGMFVCGDRMAFVPITLRTEITLRNRTLSLAFDGAEIMLEISCNDPAIKKMLKEVSENE